MSWNATWPVGSTSVRANRATGAANTTYIKTTMDVDHFWGVDPTKDGHHQFVQMPMNGTAAVPTTPTMATGMDGVIFCKAKTSTESPTHQDIQPFFLDNTVIGSGASTQLMQLLGIRVCCAITVAQASPFAITVDYVHGMSPVPVAGISGVIERSGSTGLYDVCFSSAQYILPTDKYLVLGGCYLYDAGKLGNFCISDSTSIPMRTSQITFQCTSVTGTPTRPARAWFILFGG